MRATITIRNDSNFSEFAANIRSFELRRSQSSRSFEARAENQSLITNELREMLLGFARGDHIFPLNFWMYEGRSLYAKFSEKAQALFKVDGIKMKGAGGLVVREDGTRVLELPRPNKEFSWFNEPHLALNPDFSPRIVESKSKGTNSMTLKQALREELAHRLLSAQGLSLRPLLAGAFTDKGRLELDLNHEPTGAVFVEASPKLQMLGEKIGYEIVPRGGDFEATQFSVYGGEPTGDFAKNIVMHHSMVHKAFRTKRCAIDAVGLIRHVGHLDNFLYDPATKRILVSDLDSVGLLGHDDLRGGEAAAIVRDIASDTNRTVSSLTLRTFSQALLRVYTMDPKYNPFLPVLHGYFGDDVPGPAVAQAALRLHQRYLEFLGSNLSALMMLYRERIKQIDSTGNRGTAAVAGNWKYLHASFMSDILPEIFSLYKQSSLSKRYPIPETVTDQSAQEHFRIAGRLLYEAHGNENKKYNLRVSVQ